VIAALGLAGPPDARWSDRAGDAGVGRVLVIDGAVASAVALALLSLSAVSLSAVRLPTGWTVAVVVAFVALHATLALRRIAPVAGYLIACAAMLVVVLAPEAPVAHPVSGGIDAFPLLFLPSSLTFLPVLYAVCARGEHRRSVAAIVMAAFGVVVAAARAGNQIVPPGYPPAVQYRVYLALALLSAVSAAWGLGVSRATRAAREAARRVETARSAVLADRTRIARDMHDVVAHSLAVIVRQAEGGAVLAGRDGARAEQVLRTIAEVGREALTDMRGMLAVLRAPESATLDPPADTGTPAGGLAGTPTGPGAWPCLADLPALLDRVRASGVDVAPAEAGTRHDLGAAGELAAYHVLREALTNVVKHAGPGSHVAVSLDWQPGGVIIEVRDDGAGGRRSGQHPPVPGTGSGLRGLRDRVEAVGGSCDAGAAGTGFAVRAFLPRRGNRAEES
jgi:signal transduction histidine kinase